MTQDLQTMTHDYQHNRKKEIHETEILTYYYFIEK